MDGVPGIWLVAQWIRRDSKPTAISPVSHHLKSIDPFTTKTNNKRCISHRVSRFETRNIDMNTALNIA